MKWKKEAKQLQFYFRENKTKSKDKTSKSNFERRVTKRINTSESRSQWQTGGVKWFGRMAAWTRW